MDNCIFCKIINGEIPSEKVWENESAVAFKDINSKARVHVLVVPRKHISSLDNAEQGDEALLGKLLYCVSLTAKSLGLSGGYKVIINTGTHGGQVIEHLHVHILGGEKISGIV